MEDIEIDNDLLGLKLEQGQIPLSEAIKYIVAGKCIFTFVNTANGNHITFKCQAAKGKNNKVNRNLYFISALCGPNNTSDYKYFGLIRIINGNPVYEYADKAKISREAKTVSSFEYIWYRLLKGDIFTTLEMYYSSHCCRCGKRITTPTSVSQGFGPTCIKLFKAGK